MQGQLLGERISVEVDTASARSGKPLSMRFDSDLGYEVADASASPRFSVPLIDVKGLDKPSIVDDF